MSQNSVQKVLDKFAVSICKLSNKGDLQKKIKHCAETIRKAQGIPSNSILTQGNIKLFSQILMDSKEVSIQYQDVLHTNYDLHHKILLKFEAGKCHVVSALFPSPLVVAEGIDKDIGVCCMMQIEEFFNVIKVVRVFGGKHVTIKEKSGVLPAKS